MQQHTTLATSGATSFPRAGRWVTALLALALVACGGGGGDSGNALAFLPTGTLTSPATPPDSPTAPTTPATPQPFAIGGTVSGLKGSGLVLLNNGGDALPVSADGVFTFPTALAQGAPYAVSVQSQPGGPSQVCTVNAGTGTVADTAVTSVKVVCATQAFTVNVTVSGLDGQGLVLQNNAGDDLAVGANGKRQFATRVAADSAYAVTVKSQPRMYTQFCTVSQGSGTAAAADIDDVSVACSTPATQSVYVSALLGSIVPLLTRYSGVDLSDPVSTIMPATFTSLAADPKGRLVFGGSDNGRVYAILQGNNTDSATPAALGSSGTVTLGSHPSGDYLYAITGGDGFVTTYGVPPATPGTLSLLQQRVLYGANGTSVLPLAVDPLGRFMFVGTSGQGLVMLPIRADGTLADSVWQGTPNVVSVAIHPSGAYLYAIGTDGLLHTFSINASTGSLTQTALTPASLGSGTPTSLAIDGRGRMLSLVDTANQLQYTRAITDAATGALGAPFAINGLPGPVATAFDPSRDGVNYLVDSLNLYRRTIDPAAGNYANTLFTSVTPSQIKAMVLLNR